MQQSSLSGQQGVHYIVSPAQKPRFRVAAVRSVARSATRPGPLPGNNTPSPPTFLGLRTPISLAATGVLLPLQSHSSRQYASRFQHALQAAAAVEAETESDSPEPQGEEPNDNTVVETGAELGNVQTPASVWLPYSTSGPGKVETTLRVGEASVTVDRKMGRHIQQLSRLPGYLAAVISFKTQQVMLGSTWNKMIAVFAIGIPACIAGGVAYSLASGRDILTGFIQAYGALYKIPGVTVIGEVNAWTSNVMNFIWLIGTFTFAVVLAVVTEDIVATVLAIRKGNYPVVATNHTLILNWNSQTVPLLRQIAINKKEQAGPAYAGPVVVLADREKEEMDEELRHSLKGYKIEWHTRCGVPHCSSDLERVAAGQAKNIILLDNNIEDVGQKQVAAVLGIQAARANTSPRPFLKLKPQHIAVQVPAQQRDKEIVNAAKNIMFSSAQKLQLTELSGRRDMSLLLAQSAVQPGVASVYCSIVQQTSKSVEFFFKHFSMLEGKTYSEARRMFESAVAVGVYHKSDNAININPDEKTVFQPGDQIVVLSNTGKFFPVEQAPEDPAEAFQKDKVDRVPSKSPIENIPLDQTSDPIRSKPKHLVLILREDNVGDLANSLQMFAPKGSTVTVISKEKPEDWPTGEGLLPRCRFKHLEGDSMDGQVLRNAGVINADAIIIGNAHDADPKDADAQTLGVLLLIQDILVHDGRDQQRPCHIVSTVRRPQTIEVANYLVDRLGKKCVTAELLQPDELISGMISQVAAEPEMALLLNHFIYSTSGSEIYLRRPSRYHTLTDKPETFAQIGELARTKKETAIGYITHTGVMRLAPKPKEAHTYASDDRIIVIADD
ncbi:MAG: hypothetical protein FRX49_10813 [Trebouxia sp. A1-2]|nr:MAG: hypothetical protein FRX49_10813 [Trebouxia sp. A1-2]